MCHREILHATSCAAVLLSISSCMDPATGVTETLGAAIRDVGFRCDSVVSSHAMNESSDSWRIACSDAQVYAASVEAGGELCIEPVPVGGPPGPWRVPIPSEPQEFPAARCTSHVSFQ